MAPETSTTGTGDALDQLERDHRLVEQLFARANVVRGADRLALLPSIVEALTAHATLEEDIVYPAMASTVGGGELLTERSRAEHDEMKVLLGRLDGAVADDATLTADLRTLQLTVHAHVAVEEGELFPAYRVCRLAKAAPSPDEDRRQGAPCNAGAQPLTRGETDMPKATKSTTNKTTGSRTTGVKAAKKAAAGAQPSGRTVAKKAASGASSAPRPDRPDTAVEAGVKGTPGYPDVLARTDGDHPVRDREYMAPFAQRGERLTTSFGTPVDDTDNTLRAASRGPTLLEDFHLREKIMHFDHERIPERVVHARGNGAHGVFELYESLGDLTCAAFLADPAVETPVFVRFSTVLGSRGASDTAREVRGFATKFYTAEGNFDLVGNNIPCSSSRTGSSSPTSSTRRSRSRDREIPQAATAHDTFWDFVSLHARVDAHADVGDVGSRDPALVSA